MTTLVIRSNLDTAADVLITDLGFWVPQAGGTEIFIDVVNLQDASDSLALRALATDTAFPGGTDPSSATLILNDGSQDIPPSGVDQFLGTLVTANRPRVYNEPLTGLINGANKVFTTSVIFVPGSEVVLFNGVTQLEGIQSDYVRQESVPGSGFDTVLFFFAPRTRSGSRTDDAVACHFDAA